MLEPQSFSRPVTIDGAEHSLGFGPSERRGVLRSGAGLLLPALYPRAGVASPLDVACQWLPRLERTGGGECCDRNGCAALRQGRRARAESQGDDVWTINVAGGFRITLMSPARYANATVSVASRPIAATVSLARSCSRPPMSVSSAISPRRFRAAFGSGQAFACFAGAVPSTRCLSFATTIRAVVRVTSPCMRGEGEVIRSAFRYEL